MMVLVKAAMRLAITGWVVFIIFLAVPGAPGWLSPLSMAIFAVAAWDLMVIAGFWVREVVRAELERQRGRQAEIDQCEAAFAALRVRDKKAHHHEMSAARVSGYLMAVGWVQGRVIANTVITVPEGSLCGLCTARAAGYGHDGDGDC